MSLSALFYANGALEGYAGYLGATNPEKLVEGERIESKLNDKDGRMFARRFGLVIGSFSVVSVLMARLPESPVKHLVGVGWLMFHAGVAIERTFFEPRLATAAIHSVMALGFVYYLYRAGLSKNTLMPWLV